MTIFFTEFSEFGGNIEGDSYPVIIPHIDDESDPKEPAIDVLKTKRN